MLSDAVNRLDGLLNVDFHKKLLSASLKSLAESSNPLSFNNFSAAFRELVRHVLSDLAPDAEIKACSWYKPDKSSRTGITRAHAITYVIQGGLSDGYVFAVLHIDVTDEKKALIASINELNKYTHVNAGTFGIAVKDANEMAELSIGALCDILERAHECRVELAEALEKQIQNEVVALAISETIGSVDELATHHTVADIDVEEVRVTKVDSKYIHLHASGTVGAELQWGSNSDLRSGDGALGNESFPFSCELQSDVQSPEEVEALENSLCVDTSSWWENYYDET